MRGVLGIMAAGAVAAGSDDDEVAVEVADVEVQIIRLGTVGGLVGGLGAAGGDNGAGGEDKKARAARRTALGRRWWRLA